MKYDRLKHDPAHAGIFIHGGSNVFPATHPKDFDWWHKQQEKNGANRFSITTPTVNRRGQKIPDDLRAIGNSSLPPFPTFEIALSYAKVYRARHEVLADCHIYACTDCVMESRGMGRFAVQLVSTSRLYRPNGGITIRGGGGVGVTPAKFPKD